MRELPRYLNSLSLHGNFLVWSTERYRLKLFDIGANTRPEYYRQDVAGTKCSSCQPEWYERKLSESPVDSFRARFICLLMKKRPMPICTVHLFPEITHRQFRKLTQRSPLSFTEPVYSCIWRSSAVFISQLLNDTASHLTCSQRILLGSSLAHRRSYRQTSGNVKVDHCWKVPMHTWKHLHMTFLPLN